MLIFNKKAATTFVSLLALSLIVGWVCLDRMVDNIFPASNSAIPWSFEAKDDSFRGGTYSLSLIEETYSLEYKYFLTEKITFPNVMTVLASSKNMDVHPDYLMTNKPVILKLCTLVKLLDNAQIL